MPNPRKIVDGIALDPRQNLEYYTKSAVASGEWTDAEIRREYSRLRDIAQKRLQTLARNEPNSYAYKKNVGEYPVLKEAGTEGAKALLPQLARFIAAKTGTVKGIREQRTQAIQTLQEHGYDFINQSNIRQFGEFMEAYRADKALQVVGSPTVVDLFGAAKERHMNIEDIKEQFAMWLDALPELQQVPPIPDRKKRNKETGKMETVKASADDYQKAVNKLRKQSGKPPLRKQSAQSRMKAEQRKQTERKPPRRRKKQ